MIMALLDGIAYNGYYYDASLLIGLIAYTYNCKAQYQSYYKQYIEMINEH